MLADYIHPITTWLHSNPQWAGVFAFLVAFTESLAIIGTIIPGSVTLTAVGILIGAGIIPIGLTMFWAIVGAICGDLLSFWLGYHFHESLRKRWPFYKYPNLLDKGEQFFRRHGGKSIFLGRFIGPIRSILPLTAGILNMPVWRFIIVDVISGILWAPSYMLPGILIGAASVELAPDMATRFIFYILLGLIAIWIFTWLIKKILNYCLKRIDNALNATWSYLLRHKPSHFLTTMLQDPRYPNDHGQLSKAISLCFSLGLLIALALSIKFSHFFEPLNSAVFHLLQNSRSLWLDKIMLSITFLGQKKILMIVFAAITLWLINQRDWRTTFHWLLNGVLTAASAYAIKYTVLSSRPLGLHEVSTSPSFPSGHTTLNTAIFGFLAVLFSYNLAKDIPRRLVWIPTTILVTLVALSRIYLGAHWLTDVIAGLLLGTSCVLITTISYRRQLTRAIRIVPLLLVLLLSLIPAYSYYSWQHFDKKLQKFQPFWPEKALSFQAWQQQNKPVLPLYRLSRSGHPSSELNVQWASTLSDIESHLQQQGWQIVPQPTILQRIERLLSKDKTQQLPVLDKLYQGQAASLEMIKRLNSHQPIILLRLWPSRLHFSDQSRPLWLGSVHSRVVWQHHWLPQNHTKISNMPAALDILRADLKPMHWKQRSYPATVRLDEKDDLSTVLLVY